MKVLNKSKRTIDGIKPNKVADITNELGEKLTSMYKNEVVRLDSDTNTAKANSILEDDKKLLEMEIEELQSKIITAEATLDSQKVVFVNELKAACDTVEGLKAVVAKLQADNSKFKEDLEKEFESSLKLSVENEDLKKNLEKIAKESEDLQKAVKGSKDRKSK